MTFKSDSLCKKKSQYQFHTEQINLKRSICWRLTVITHYDLIQPGHCPEYGRRIFQTKGLRPAELSHQMDVLSFPIQGILDTIANGGWKGNTVNAQVLKTHPVNIRL